MAQKSNFFAFISRMKYISRWGLMRNTQNENLKEHSFDVAILTQALLILANTEFGRDLDVNFGAALALYHDCGEIFTGDLPTPVKYHSDEMKKAYAEMEYSAKEKMLSLLPGEMKNVYYEYFFGSERTSEYLKYVKAADKLSAYLKCLEEEKAGNSEFKNAKASLLKLIRSLGLPEAELFLERFADGYALTLDELG